MNERGGGIRYAVCSDSPLMFHVTKICALFTNVKKEKHEKQYLAHMSFQVWVSLEYSRRETEDTDCSESELKLSQFKKGGLEYKLHESKASKFEVVLRHLKALLEKHYKICIIKI